jgi:hypothetical protein
MRDPEAWNQAQELFAEVALLGSQGRHAEAQAVQERANVFWLRAYGREAKQ